MIVAKFGGSSIADADRIRAVCEIVRGLMPRRPLVVLSALGGVTDLLEQAIACAGRDDLEALERTLADLERRQRWALAGTVEHAGRRHDLSLELDRQFEDLRQRLRSMRILGEMTPRGTDAVLAAGELLSGRIVCAALSDRGLPAEWIDPRSLLVTDDRFGEARADPDPTRRRCAERVLPRIESGALPVTGGFVGASAAGETTTLGRGGSDTSAAVLGLGLDAEEIQIWTDVDGLMSGDPRRVSGARTLDSVSFDEAAELARFGARVLHPDAIAPAVRREIPVRVLNSLRPGGSGTLILGRPRVQAGPPVAVTCRAEVDVVEIRCARVSAGDSLARRALEILEQAGRIPELMVATGCSVSMALQRTAVPADRLAGLGDELVVEVRRDRAIVCVVGSGLSEPGAERDRVVAALARWSPEMLALGASRTSIAAVVSGAVLEDCLQGLHRGLFGAGEQE